MKISELPTSNVCKALYNSSIFNISFSWLGTAYVVLRVEDQNRCESLASLEKKANDLALNFFNGKCDSPESFIDSAYLIERVLELRENSDMVILSTNFITQSFYWIQKSLISFISRLGFSHQSLAEWKRLSSIPIPLSIADGELTNRFPPLKDVSSAKHYRRVEIPSIYTALHPQAGI